MKKIFALGASLMTVSLLAGSVTTPTTSSVNTQMTSPSNTMNPNQNFPEKAIPAQAQDAVKDRFTSANDQKLGGQIHVQIAEIIGAPNGNAIIVIIDDGHVKMIGKVPSEEAKGKIVTTVQQIKGVKSVHNKLEVEKK